MSKARKRVRDWIIKLLRSSKVIKATFTNAKINNTKFHIVEIFLGGQLGCRY
jgi:hypothetical protein